MSEPLKRLSTKPDIPLKTKPPILFPKIPLSQSPKPPRVPPKPGSFIVPLKTPVTIPLMSSPSLPNVFSGSVKIPFTKSPTDCVACSAALTISSRLTSRMPGGRSTPGIARGPNTFHCSHPSKRSSVVTPATMSLLILVIGSSKTVSRTFMMLSSVKTPFSFSGTEAKTAEIASSSDI